MGKKRIRKSYKSAGLHSNVSGKHKYDLWSPADRAIFKVRAKKQGKRVCYTVPNPDKNNTKERFIRVCE